MNTSWGFTTSAGGHLLPLHNPNLWRELVGWRLSTGEGWRETKKIFHYEVDNMNRDPYFTWVEVGGVERDKERGWKRRGGEEEKEEEEEEREE